MVMRGYADDGAFWPSKVAGDRDEDLEGWDV